MPANTPQKSSNGAPDFSQRGTIWSDPNLGAAVILRSQAVMQVLTRAAGRSVDAVLPSVGLAADFLCINGPCFAARRRWKRFLMDNSILFRNAYAGR